MNARIAETHCDEHGTNCVHIAVLRSDADRNNDAIRDHETRLRLAEAVIEKMSVKLALLSALMSGGAAAVVQFVSKL